MGGGGVKRGFSKVAGAGYNCFVKLIYNEIIIILFVLAKWELILKLFQNSLSCLYDDPKYTFGTTLAKIDLFSGLDAARTTGVDNIWKPLFWVRGPQNEENVEIL